MMPMRHSTAKRGGRVWPSPMKRPNTVAALMRATAAEDERVPHLFCQIATSISQTVHSFTNGIINFVK